MLTTYCPWANCCTYKTQPNLFLVLGAGNSITIDGNTTTIDGNNITTDGNNVTTDGFNITMDEIGR